MVLPQVGATLWLFVALMPVSALAAEAPADSNELLIVDCALPGQVKRLGQRITYLSSRKPVQTTAWECRVRGGEYVAHDRASSASSLKVWLEQAKAGNAYAQTMVGEIFQRGLGTQPDFIMAMQWYQRAAKQNDMRAQVNIGYLHEAGLGVAKNLEFAQQWYRQAAGAGGDILMSPSQSSATLNRIADQETLLAAALAEATDVKQNLPTQSTELHQERLRLLDIIASLEQRLRNESAVRAEQSESVDVMHSVNANLQREIAALQKRLAQQVSSAESEQAQKLQTALQTIAQLNAAVDVMARNNAATPEMIVSKATFEKPTITLLEPRHELVNRTRGLVKVTSMAAVSQRLVGRVVAPAGLYVLNVNGRPATTNAFGVFQFQLSDRTDANQVEITAIDQRGQSASLQLTFAATQPDTVVADIPPIDFGRYYALLIGNNDYQSLPDLKTPINDVRRIREILQKRFGFEVRLLENASRYDILSALNDLRRTLTSEDNLLIYYAGHGELDEVNMRGHWLPVDAQRHNTANWLSNVDVTDILNVIEAKQVMLVADSCYAGTLTRSSVTQIEGAQTDEEWQTWLRLLVAKRARVVMTSGGLAPVLDLGSRGHSVFAGSFIDALSKAKEVVLGQALYKAVAARVAHAASNYEFEQIPEFAAVARAGHEAGDFIFVPRN